MCWNGSPYQPVPVAEDVRQQTAISIMEQGEDFPAVLVEAQNVRAYPSPYGINAAHLLGYLSPITEGELDEAEADDDSSVHGASVVGRAGLEKEYDRYLRGYPGYKKVAVDSMGRVLGDSGVERRPRRRHSRDLDRRPCPGGRRAAARCRPSRRRAQTYDPVSHKNYVADQGAVVVLDAKNGRRRRDGQLPDVRPEGVGRRHHREAAGQALLHGRRHAAALPRHPGQLRARLDVEADHDHRRVRRTATGRRAGSTAPAGCMVGNRLFKNYESASYGIIDFAKALQISCDTFFYRVGLGFWQKYGSDPADVKARDPLVETAQMFGFGKATGIDLPGEATGRIADRALEARLLQGQQGLLLQARQEARATTPSYGSRP